MDTPVVTERRDAVLHVWLDQPAKRNALGTETLAAVADVFAGVARDHDVRAVVLGGRGPSFSAGADRGRPPGGAAFVAGSERARRWWAQLGRRAVRAVEECEVPTIARLHGHVVGGAAALAVACDFRLAADDTVFSIPEVDLGIPLLWGALPRLIHEIGAARAREAVLLCDRIDAGDAERWGLVHRSVPAAELDALVERWAARLAAKPEIAVHMTKTQLRAYATVARLGDVSEGDADALLAAFGTPAARQSFPRRE